MSDRTLREMIAGLDRMGTVELRGETYTGTQLAVLVMVNPELPVQESANTPALVFQLGRLAAAALAEQQQAELRLRVWRDVEILEIITDLDMTQQYDPEATKPMSKTAAEAAVRTNEEYVDYYKAKIAAEEVHGVFYAAYEAAKIRQRAIYDFENHAGGTGHTRTPDTDAGPGAAAYPEAGQDLASREEKVTAGARTPLGPRVPPGPPPGPAPRRKAAPPPPPTSNH